jgi:hypothetical protein
MDNKIADSTRIAPFIIIPSNQLKKVGVKFDSSLSVEDAGVCATNKIGRDNFILGDIHDAFVFFALGSFLECFCDVVISGFFLEAYNEIDDGTVDSGDTEGHTAGKIKKELRVMKPKGKGIFTNVSLPSSEGITLVAALAAPVEAGIMLLLTVRPPRQSL